jgi:hypothetical protein
MKEYYKKKRFLAGSSSLGHLCCIFSPGTYIFESFRFMPVTRDMTSGQRTLLYKFIDEAGEGALEASITRSKTLKTFAELSRSMRRG